LDHNNKQSLIHYDGDECEKTRHDKRCDNMGFTSLPRQLQAKVVRHVSVYPNTINVIDAKKKKKNSIEKTFGSFVILTQFNNSFEKLTYVRKV
jgi:hypothetical protein